MIWGAFRDATLFPAMGLLMSVNGKFTDFRLEDLLAVADRFAIGTASRVIDQVRKAIKAWPRHARQAGVGMKQLQNIESLLLPSLPGPKKQPTFSRP
jgi:hypothetical protein